MRIAVTGMGIVCAAGAGVDAFTRALEEGRPGDRAAEHLEAPEHQARIGATIPVPELATQKGPRDRAFPLASRALGEALTCAGLTPADLPDDTALLVGTSLGGALAAQRWHEATIKGEPGRRADLLQAPLHSLSDHLAREYGLRGPRTTISNACVSGTNALGLALGMLRAGECEIAIAGGVDTLHSFNFAGFATLWALTSEKVRPFDPRRTGMLLGEASAFLVLETEERARARLGDQGVLAEVAGYGSSGDAVHITAPDREGGGAYRAIAQALQDAGVGGDEVDFVSLHGTGTMYMDSMEAAAMGRVFGDRVTQVPATSLRPVTGHTLGSAGAVDSVACLIAIQEGFVPPTANHGELDPNLPNPLRIVSEVLRGPVEVALNTCSGFAGSNAAVVFRRWRTA